KEARQHFARAIELLESRLSKLHVEERRSSLRETGRDAYSDIIEAHLAAGDVQAAWEYSERARARTFLNQLGNIRLMRASPQAPPYGPDYEEMSGRLAVVVQRLYKARANGDADLSI